MKLNYLIDLALYMFFGLGIILYFYNDIDLLIARYKIRHRLKALKVETKALPKPLEYIYQLINNVFEHEYSKRIFIISEALLFVLSYILSYRNFNPLTAVFVSLIFIALPIMLLAAKLEASRAKASREGISLVTELHRQYRINNLNIYEAIEKTALANGDFNLSAKYLYKLLIRLRTACGPIEIIEAIDSFVFSFGTFWARMLGQCIKLSIESGSDVSAGLSDIVVQLKEANSLNEKRRLLNSEASRMTLLLVPLMYIACIATSVLYLHLSVSTLINNQFLNPTGFLLFLICIFLFFINLLLLNFVSNDKLDF